MLAFLYMLLFILQFIGFYSSCKYGDKFGVPMTQLPLVIDEAKKCGLIVDTIHFHAGWNMPESSIDKFEKVITILKYIFPLLFICTLLIVLNLEPCNYTGSCITSRTIIESN